MKKNLKRTRLRCCRIYEICIRCNQKLNKVQKIVSKRNFFGFFAAFLLIVYIRQSDNAALLLFIRFFTFCKYVGHIGHLRCTLNFNNTGRPLIDYPTTATGFCSFHLRLTFIMCVVCVCACVRGTR